MEVMPAIQQHGVALTVADTDIAESPKSAETKLSPNYSIISLGDHPTARWKIEFIEPLL